MEKIYKITKGQLISLWLFGVIGWFYVMDSYSDLSGFLSIFIPAILIFYTIGWRAHRNIQGPLLNIDAVKIKNRLKTLPKILLPIILIIGFLVFGIIKFYDNKEVKQDRENYVGIFNRYQKNVDNAKKCMEQKNAPLIEQYTNECKDRYNKAYLSYKDCKKDMPWQSHNQCLNWFDSNYEEIDCSEATMTNKANSINEYSCYSDLRGDLVKITSFEQSIVIKFLDSYSKDKAVFSQSEIQKLYDSFPQEVFSEKTKARLNKFIEDKGYVIEK